MLEEATIASSKLPVLVELRYWQGSIEQLIRDSLMRHEMPAELFEEALKRSLLLFDGVNELPSEEARSQLSAFRRNHRRIPIVYTTRDLSLGGDLGIEAQLEMHPLKPEQMEAFIRAYLSAEQAEQMLRQLNDRLREFGQTPLLLWMLCEVTKQMPDARLPSNLAETFQFFTTAYEISSVRKHEVAVLKGDVRPLSDRRLWKKALKALAFLMIQGKTPADPKYVIPRGEAEEELSRIFPNELFPVRDLLDDLLKYHLLQIKNADQIEFRHQLIQEYYAAEALLEQLPKLDDERLKWEFLNFLKWTEPIALMLGLLKDEAHALSIVKLGLEIDWMLGARLAGKVCESLQSKTIDLIVNQPISEHFRLYLLGMAHSDTMLPLIAEALESEDNNICLTAVTILANLGTKSALEALVKTLDHKNYDVRRAAAVKLAEVVDQSVSQLTISTLIAKLLNKTEAPEIRSSCMIALGKTRNQIARCMLQNVISDPLEKAIVRANAANALVEADPQLALIALQKALKDKDDTVSWSASLDLGRIGGQTVETILCEALLDENSNARMNAAFGLMSINCKTACASLTRALQNELSNAEEPYSLWHLQNLRVVHANVLIRLIEALGHLECTEASQSLLTLCEHTDLNVQASAIKAIGKIQKKKALPLLENLLNGTSYFTDSEDHESYRRAIFLAQAAAEGLGETGCVDALSVLKRALTSPNILVRADVILGLEKLRLKEILPVLLNALGDSAEIVRESAAMVFDNLGQDFIDKDDRQIISALSDYLEDENSTVRKHITQALWRIGGEVGDIAQFIKALKDTENMSRMSAARRLGQIVGKSDEISSALLNALEKDEDVGVQTCAAESLGKIANPKLVPQLYQLQLVHQREYVSDAIFAIQEKCEYYDDEVFQNYLEAQKADRQTPQNNDLNAITKQTSGTVIMNQPVFNQQNANIGINYAAEGSNPQVTQHNYGSQPNTEATQQLVQLLTQLQAQHPYITTKTQALDIIDAEFTEIRRSENHPLATLRQQLLNPERHFQAIKATLGEVAKHYLEESVWAKAIITYIDKLSETPDYGV
ncbi:HEAT repeat domain-containing protein [Leptolyngbya sp. DQ-M1]|uniref:HEAT repeat domain-containing protein n=1 Tax=Leptolyngbya sp. DQ-M1 TaxID=2933920 RepID=UPI00329939D6